jgi:hypothetical protein
MQHGVDGRLKAKLDETLRIWATLRYLHNHEADPIYSRNRGTNAVACFLKTNYPAARTVLEMCYERGWATRESARGTALHDATTDKRNPLLYAITAEGEYQLDSMEKALRPIYFERMLQVERRVG